MIERHVTLNVPPDRGGDLELLFDTEYARAMSEQPGFVSVSLLRENDNPQRYTMAIRFESEDAAAAWRASQVHKALSPRLKEVHCGSEVTVHTVLSHVASTP